MGGVDWPDLRARLGRLPRRASRAASPRRAAVLVPLLEREGALVALFTRRPETLRAHPGQVSFPGGGLHPGEDALAGALREAEEEVGLPPRVVEPLGLLHDVEVAGSGVVMTPVVGRVTQDVPLVLDPAEVAHAFTAPLAGLAGRLEVRPFEHAGRTWQVPFFEWEGETIWGATGRVVVDLLRVLDLLE
ncbi:MAG: CoA pyrophosphatase [Planctomycetes bacterium]|nr:CoA pyrophosphatase [Planctomycetota bacterium]